MNRFRRPFGAPRRTHVVGVIAGLAGFAAAALVGVAVASTFTLKVAKSAQVTNQAGATASENIVVTSHGFAVYELTGDSKSHPECKLANSCFGFWPPLKVSSAKHLTKAPGIRGKLGVWHRNGFLQLTLAGHPLYRYVGDSQKNQATGQGINSFGGTWHVIKVGGSPAVGSTSTSGTTTTTMTTTTTTTTTTGTTGTTPCPYPGYC